ncbi:FAD-binding domain-containing protein [Lophiostoma macrostomum CBS 122681]|uniref:FAD-binding domain-containing protein n=1 Tax=Lophiostoma macrostomum CBS 122681 TaxID=1314788 RepID=A0A6A6SJM0_9PLEO|nr:FAD-binding domain-containing protein [Lophiostoma macrostomum CBS 122681]
MDWSALMTALPRVTYLPPTPQYQNSTSSYFSAFENELQPTYVLLPKVTQDVVDIIKYLVDTPADVKVAVRGGGHTPWAGAANIESGITIDLRQLTGITINSENVVSIAAGEVWANVYQILEKRGLAVVGRRVSKVGVAGGLSYFSESTGFVCDNVINFEVVLSEGNIVQANKVSNPDLFRGLKGGTNNFGIVTRFDLPAFDQGNMWGGAVYYPSTTYVSIIEDLYSFTSTPESDPHAHLIAATVHSPLGPVNVVNVYYAKPTSHPPSLAPFTKIQPQLADTIREDSLLGFANEQSSFSTNGARQLFFTTTIRLDKQLMLDMQGLYSKTVESTKTVPGLTLSMVFQPLTKHLLQQSATHGPNSLGLLSDGGPFVITLLNSVHTHAADDSDIINAKVSEKYDPSGFFQTRVPGGFKLP